METYYVKVHWATLTGQENSDLPASDGQSVEPNFPEPLAAQLPHYWGPSWKACWAWRDKAHLQNQQWTEERKKVCHKTISSATEQLFHSLKDLDFRIEFWASTIAHWMPLLSFLKQSNTEKSFPLRSVSSSLKRCTRNDKIGRLKLYKLITLHQPNSTAFIILSICFILFYQSTEAIILWLHTQPEK